MPYPPPSEAAAREAALSLLGSVWPTLPRAIALAGSRGSDWFEVSTPFIAWEGERAVGLVGVIEVSLYVEGQRRTLAGVHGVCVAPDRRGQGHMRAPMEQALAFVDAHWDSALLFASVEPLYTRFGFEKVPMHTFCGPLPRGAGSTPDARRLDFDDASDRALLLDLLGRRAPMGPISAAEPGWHFTIDYAIHEALGFPPALWHVPSLDAVAVTREAQGRLTLLDLVAAEPPPTSAVLAHVPTSAAELVVSWGPPYGWDGPPLTPTRWPDEDLFMMRGAPLGLSGEVGISPMVEC